MRLTTTARHGMQNVSFMRYLIIGKSTYLLFFLQPNKNNFCHIFLYTIFFSSLTKHSFIK